MPHTERAYTYEPLSQYPGLRPNDRAIWDAFLARHPKRFGRVFYDVHLGEHSQIEEGVHPRAASAWYDLTRWKLDVLAEDEAFVYAIEIKPEANAKAIGQALCYACLIHEDWGFEKPVIPVVLTDEEIPTTKRCAKKLSVQLWVVPVTV